MKTNVKLAMYVKPMHRTLSAEREKRMQDKDAAPIVENQTHLMSVFARQTTKKTLIVHIG